MSLRISCLVAAAFLLMANSANAQMVVGADDFDGGEMFMSRVATPDNSGSPVPGTFPGSIFDVFGIVDRSVNFDLADDTLIDPMFTGFAPSTLTDSFFATEDLENGDNPGGMATLVYQFDISGATDLQFSADFGAWGDFEIANDINTIFASIDGQPQQLIMELVVDEEATQTYTYEDGSSEDFNDPICINGTFLSNSFQNFSAPIAGTGNVLTLTFNFAGNGGNEIIAIDNLLIESGKGGGGDLIGDVNCDGVIDLLDVGPFVDAITTGTFSVKADINEDGFVDLLDVGPFVALLTGG